MTGAAPRVLITRPQPECAVLADRLAAHGLTPVQAPMLDIIPIAGAALALDDVQAVLLTSAAAARCAPADVRLRGLPVLAVGDATAEAARAAGFTSVTSAGGDARALAALVRDTRDPSAGTLLHLAGRVVAGGLAASLSDAGFALRRVAVYDARPSQALSAAVCEALTAGTLKAALFFSPRSAATFVTLARRGGVAEGCRNTLALCMSDAVIAAVEGLPWGGLRRAARPDLEAMIALVTDAVSK